MTDHPDPLARYMQLRKVSRALNNRLVKTLTKEEMDAGGRALGLLQNNVLVFDTEDEMSVLMDHCLHDVRLAGASPVERYLAESPPPAGSDERTLLEALARARYALLVVEGREPGRGVRVRDLLRDESFLLTDVGFSQSARPGTVLATRVFTAEGIHMTTGAALPIGLLSPAEQNQFLWRVRALAPGRSFGELSPAERTEVVAAITRGALEQGAAERIAYVDAGTPVRPAQEARAGTRRIARNEPCPCGSGRKYKNCCGARR